LTKYGRRTPEGIEPDDDVKKSPIIGNILDLLNPDLVMNINQSIDSNSRGTRKTNHPKGSSVQTAINSSLSNTNNRPLSAQGKKKKGPVVKQDVEKLQISSKHSKIKSSRMSQGYKPLKNY
jgi:hypothetical protein